MPEPLFDLSWKDLLFELSSNDNLCSGSSEEENNLDAFWAELERRLHSLCGKMTSSRYGISDTDREDIVQEILTKLQSKSLITRIGKARTVEGYFFTMIRNRANDFARKRKIREQSVFYHSPQCNQVPSHESTIAEYEILKRISELVREGSEQEARLLEMRFSKELSIKEIAQITGRSYSAVAVQLFRLIRRLRKDVKEEYLQ